MTDAFGPHIEAVAREVWGDPNPRLSNKRELRWGAHGSKSVDLQKGVWHDHEACEGGGVLDLLKREHKLVNGAALDHLRENHGADVGRPLQPREPAPVAKIVATYDYVDEHGEVLFQVCRQEPKTFRQRRPDGNGGWSWSVKGVRPIPYRLTDFYGSESATVYVVEGEKDADALAALGLRATCNAGGGGKWTADHAAFLSGLDVVILPDNDDIGRKHADQVAVSLQGVAASVCVVDLPDLPPKGDVSDWLASGGSAAALLALSVQTPEWRPAPPQSAFGAVLWSDMDKAAPTELWAVEDVLHRGDIGLVYGASMSGKSFLTLDMALCIARGEPWFGRKVQQGGVIYQAGEGGKGLLKRMRAYRDQHHVVGQLPFVLLPQRINLWDPNGDGDAFLAEVEAYARWMGNLQLVVIDTWATASAGANENRSEDASVIMARGERLRDATGAAVLWVHHKNASGEKPRGHTSILANADMAIEVTRDDTEPSDRKWKLAKVKDGEDGEEVSFRLQAVTIGSNDDGKPITSCVVTPGPAQDGSSRPSSGQDRKPNPLPAGQRLFLTCLDDAISQLGERPPREAGAPSGSYAVEWRHFTRVYTAVRGSTHDENAIRQALKRDGDALTAAGMIGRHQPWVWLSDRGARYLGFRNGSVTDA